MASTWTIKPNGTLYGVRGDTAKIVAVWTDGAGNPVDLTGCTLKSQVRTGPNGYIFLEFDMSQSVLATGKIVWYAPSVGSSPYATSAIQKTEGFFDTQITYPDGTVYTIIGPAKAAIVEKDISL